MRSHGRTAALAALLATALLAPAAQAQAPAGKSITAIGVGTAKVEPEDRRSNASITAAVRAAREAALPRALEDGRLGAIELAQATGMGLGGLTAVADTPSTPYGPFGYESEGTFGPGRWCGEVRRPRYRVVDGRRRRAGSRTRRVCHFPRQISRQVTVTYAAT